MWSAHHQIGQAAPPQSFELTAADEWFAAIDGQTVRCRNLDWRVQVFGIHRVEHRSWFQVGFEGPQQVNGTFEATHEHPKAFLEALTAWLETTEETPSTVPTLL